MSEKDFMNLAIIEAKIALKKGDVPVGAVIVKNGKVIAKSYNKKQIDGVATHHAEILAIEKACKKFKDFRLEDCEIYITKEPCLMCMGAILSARIKKIIFGTFDKKYGTIDLAQNNNFNHKCEWVGGVMQEDCQSLLSDFFKNLRDKKCM